MRPLALYLPQFHSFKENDGWWGKGYTEWTAVRGAKPLFDGHLQPRVPYDGDYYDLSDEGGERLRIQAEQAKEYGICGFVFYQYYFTGHKLMERPMEILLAHPEVDIKYCVCWANETWRRAWYDYNEEILLEQTYGGETEWKEHFDYLLKFFKDERYIKIGDKPMLCVYRPFEIAELRSMRDCFDRWAREAGYGGIYLVGGKSGPGEDTRNICDAHYYFEPGYSLKHGLTGYQTFEYNMSTVFNRMGNVIRRTIAGGYHTDNTESLKKGHGSPDTIRNSGSGNIAGTESAQEPSYINQSIMSDRLEHRVPIDWVYDAILRHEYKDNEYPGIIARWDNTPRRGSKGLVYTGASAEKFKEVLCKLKQKIPEESFVFINAWNEWGEGAMLEPDKEEGYAYLEAIREVCSENA